MITTYSEFQDSQLPALQLLQKMGWQHISPEETLNERDGFYSGVILENILSEQLQKINSFEYKGDSYKFSRGNIQAAINALKNVPDEGLVRTNEKVYDLLTLGKSFTETILGDSKGFTLKYIDWINTENNVYHITEEYEIEGLKSKRRPDIVLFVNGIPFVVIENKRRDKNNGISSEDRFATEQDKSLLALCEPKRLMDIVYKYIVFDGPIKKICRYQQFFAVQETISRVKERDKDSNRRGGVIWHTTGSGKSLTMVMISKALALDAEIENPRVVIVTDRISLDKQIFKTFENCGKKVKKAQSGSDLIALLKDRGNEIITTIIDKFNVATSRAKFKDESQNVFVLVDESHRSNYGTAHAAMKRMLPNASFIGFTGTPLMKSEKSTARKFGGFIHKYTIDQAVKDGAVLPLLYEGRSAKLTINRKQIDKGFERLAKPLSEEAQKDLKRKFSSISKIYESDGVVEEIAYDISNHYTKNWKGTGAKAQLAVPRIDVAIKYQKYFESQTDPSIGINTRVVFTPPDSRKDNEDVWTESSSESRNYWDSLMKQFRDQESYENYVVDKFKDEKDDEVEMLIVVSKLLTGFDAPVNTLLYLAKPLKGHNLLQAIARVNRLFKGKEYGYIIDYVGVLGKLDEALTEYSALEDFEEDDLSNAVSDMTEVIRQLPSHHAAVWDVFKSVKNKDDIEALERCIAQKDVRDEFYEVLSQFARTLQLSFAADSFYEEYTTEQIGFYKDTITAFQEGRLNEKEYLDSINSIRNDFDKGHQEGIPTLVKDKPEARAVFGGISQVLKETHGKEKVEVISEQLAIAGIDITKIIEDLTIRDWKKNLDVQNRMENEIEDYLMEHRKDLGVEINFDDIDAILVKCLKVAKNNY